MTVTSAKARSSSAGEPLTPIGSADLAGDRDRAIARFAAVRARTEALAAPLTAEDQQLQSMPDASPTKWHRAHTTWFFEAFVLEPSGLSAVDARYAALFNSYYEAMGTRHPRPKRGLLSRPTVAEIADYRRAVDARVTRLLREADEATLQRLLPIVQLGEAHEEQHQELLLTDILHAFSENPLRPAYTSPRAETDPPREAEPLRFVSHPGGLVEMGARLDGARGFAFDNETPRHKRWLEPFSVATRLLSVGELVQFIEAGGYRTASLWLAEGFDRVRVAGRTAPLHSTYREGELEVFTLSGPRIAAHDEPAAHLDYYEADAVARFFGARLPTEAEWETLATGEAVTGNFADDGWFRPRAPSPSAAATAKSGVCQLFGDVWEWTNSSYDAYPGYAALPGALGEYNGKFMVGQQVLRGGSCLTPRGHVRATYRNFWPPGTGFQMSGVRLARDGGA